MLNSSLCRAAAPRLHPLQLLLASRLHQSASTAAPYLRPLQLLLSGCARFSCCLPLACVCFSCCSPIASASTAPRLRPLQLLSPIASTSTAAPRLHLLVFPAHAQRSQTFPHGVRGSVNLPSTRSRVTSPVPPHEHPTSVTHRHTLKSQCIDEGCANH